MGGFALGGPVGGKFQTGGKTGARDERGPLAAQLLEGGGEVGVLSCKARVLGENFLLWSRCGI